MSLFMPFSEDTTAYKGEQTFEKANRMPFYATIPRKQLDRCYRPEISDGFRVGLYGKQAKSDQVLFNFVSRSPVASRKSYPFRSA